MRPLFLILLLLSTAVHATVFELKLKDAEAAALAVSQGIRAVEAEARAMGERNDQAWSLLWPRIGIDGSGRYNTVVPEFSLLPGKPKQKFGDNESYSVGLGATWTFWDSGNAYNLYKALSAGQASKSNELEAKKSEIRLKARMSYFQTQLMAERARLMADSLKLSQAQARDLELRLKAGASSRIDALQARNEVLQRRGQYRAARADLALALRDLFALTGLGADQDPSVPQEFSEAENPPADTESATLTLKTQSLQDSLAELSSAETAALDATHPQVEALRQAALSARKQADAAGSGNWPRLSASARTSLDYPNGPVLEQIHQNSVAVSATWNLFSFGQVSSAVDEQLALADASEARATALNTDLKRDWLKSHDRLRSLKDERALDAESVTETESLYKLIYGSYQNGSSSFLEVQSAELNALGAKVRLASTETQMLIELAVLASLSE